MSVSESGRGQANRRRPVRPLLSISYMNLILPIIAVLLVVGTAVVILRALESPRLKKLNDFVSKCLLLIVAIFIAAVAVGAGLFSAFFILSSTLDIPYSVLLSRETMDLIIPIIALLIVLSSVIFAAPMVIPPLFRSTSDFWRKVYATVSILPLYIFYLLANILITTYKGPSGEKNPISWPIQTIIFLLAFPILHKIAADYANFKSRQTIVFGSLAITPPKDSVGQLVVLRTATAFIFFFLTLFLGLLFQGDVVGKVVAAVILSLFAGASLMKFVADRYKKR